MFLIFKVALAILLIVWLFRQVRKPSGWLGRRVVRAMNIGHATMTDWGLHQITLPRNAAILDVGCGGGSTVRKLAALAPEGKVIGLDYSTASIAVSRQTMPSKSKPEEYRSKRARWLRCRSRIAPSTLSLR